MNTPLIRSLNHRLSLRPPQLASLEILADVCDRLEIPGRLAPADALDRLKETYPHVTAFDRDFPSLCFALATGVGKTRLMGAFIAYLHQTYGLRNFFVIAPNLTIYQKLITDFTP